MNIVTRLARWTTTGATHTAPRLRRAFGTADGYAEIPLESPRTQVRLLQLNAGSWDDTSSPVSGTLFRTSLVDAPPYEALSYHWGRASSLKSISLGGRDVGVQENLESALRHLRRQDEPRVLWVDALCINQDDIQERSAQVAIMHEIYSRAIRTVAWVGDGREDGELALDVLRRQADWKFLAETPDASIEPLEDELIGWDAVRRLLQRPYWRRLWVMQEIALSYSPPRVVCGRSQIGWGKLTKALEDHPTAHFVHRLQRIRGATLKLRTQSGKSKPNRIGRHIILLLSHSTGFETTEPKDRVYALYGLFRVVGIVGFTPDYSVSLARVYQQLTEYVLTMKGGLDVLELRSHSQDSGLPSWVVDFSKRPSISFERRGETPWQRREHQASVAVDPSSPSTDQQLEVSGAVFDSVSHVEPIPPCLASVFRAAAEEPSFRIFGAHSLRSDSAEAARYWALKERNPHPRELCHNTIQFLSRWQSVVSFFCGTRTNADDWTPVFWNWEEMAGIVPICNPELSVSHDNEMVQSQHTTHEHDQGFEARYRGPLDPLLSSLSVMMQGRVCFSTATGLHGVSLEDVAAGDQVVAFQATKNLHILRECHSSPGRHRYIGAAIICPSHHDAESGTRITTAYKKIAGNEIEDRKFILD